MESLRHLRKIQMEYFFTVGKSLAVISFAHKRIVVILKMLLPCGEIQTLLSQDATSTKSWLKC